MRSAGGERGPIQICDSMRGMAVAVVIISYRSAHFLRDAVDSVLAQTQRPDELVVVAGAAEDARLARELGVRVLVQEPAGLSAARNAGIEATRADCILPLDADDVLEREAVATLLARRPAADLWIVGSDVVEFGDRGRYWAPEPFTKIRETNCLAYASLYPRRLWQLAGGYDPGATVWEDWDFWLRCARHAPEVVQVRRPLLRYRIHAGQKSASERGREGDERKKLLARHGLLV